MNKAAFRIARSPRATVAGAVLAMLLVGGPSSAALPVIPLAQVDLQRMFGGWYIVATIPNFLDRGLVGGYDIYSPGEKPGWIREDFHVQRGGFSKPGKHYVVGIRVLSGTGNADWRVRPFWPLLLPFQIYYVDPEYRFALFGEQNRNWGWIYSRSPSISDAEYQGLLMRFKAFGYDITRFRKIVQTPHDIGMPGFWTDGIK